MCGDVTVLGELICDAAAGELTQEAAMAIAETLNDVWEKCGDFKKACDATCSHQCSTCHNYGHKAPTCKGWVWENMGFGH